MTSHRVNDLDHYEKLLDILENDGPYEPDFEIDEIKTQYAAIKSGVQMRMLADPGGMIEEQDLCKTECCRLLLRSLELWASMKGQPIADFGERLLKNGVVMVLIATLEELYLFYNNLSKIQAGDI